MNLYQFEIAINNLCSSEMNVVMVQGKRTTFLLHLHMHYMPQKKVLRYDDVFTDPKLAGFRFHFISETRVPLYFYLPPIFFSDSRTFIQIIQKKT